MFVVFGEKDDGMKDEVERCEQYLKKSCLHFKKMVLNVKENKNLEKIF